MHQEKSIINIVLFSVSEFDGKCMAETCWEGEYKNGVVSVTKDDHLVNVFLRWPLGYGFANPIGVTDVLVIHIAESMTDISEVQAYADARLNIPVKIVISKNEEYKSWESKGFKYTNWSSDLATFASEGYKAYEERLRTAFNKHSTDGTGIEKQNFSDIAGELGVDVNSESFSSILDNFNTNQKMSYRRFRSWYIFGKDDDQFWHKFSKNANEIENLIATRIEEVKKIFDSVTSESVPHSEDYNGNLSIGTSHPFTVNTKIGYDLLSGVEHDNAKADLPFTLSHAPFTFSLEIGIKDEAVIEKAVIILNALKHMGMSMVPEVAHLIKMGVDLQFRVASANSFFFDVVVSGLLGGVILETASKINFDLLKYAGSNKFHIHTEFSPTFLLTKNLDEIFQNVCNFEIGGEGKFANMSTVFRIVSMIVKTLSHSKKSRELDVVLNILNVFKTGEFNLKFDSSLLVNAIKTTMNLRSSKPDKFAHLSEAFSDNQKMMHAFVEQGKSMVMFIADYLDLIKNINFDKIALHLNFSIIRTSIQFYVVLNGLTDFLNQNFLD